MRRRVPLSPSQTLDFSAALTLLVIDSWMTVKGRSIEIERAMLVDFATQHPRSVQSIVPSLAPIMRAQGSEQSAVSDLFAERRFYRLEERFHGALSALLSRDLAHETREGSVGSMIELTPLGRETAAKFTSAYALGLKTIALELCREWQGRNLASLSADIRKAIPDASPMAAIFTSTIVLAAGEG